jgi:hypothetical protein
MGFNEEANHKITKYQLKQLGNDKGIFINFPINEYHYKPYPTKYSVEKEKRYLSSLKTNENIAFIKEADRQVSYFESELRKIGINEDLKNNKNIKRIIYNTLPFILELKFFYDRKRPNEVGVEDMVFLKSAQSPAYPSGHSVQSTIMSMYLADKYPNKRNEILDISERVGFSRILARVHYPSDHNFGKKLGTHLYVFYKNNTPFNIANL